MFTIKSHQPLRCSFANAERSIGTYDPTAIEKLPCELKERLASFLSTRELINLAESSKSLSSDLNLYIASSPLTDRASQDKQFRSRGAQCFAVVIPKEGDRAHSMTFSCNVRNHGFGNSADVFIMEQNPPPTRYQHPELLRDFNRGKEIAKTSTQTKSKVCLSFPVKPNKFYQFFISTRGQEQDDVVRFSEMSLQRVGFSKKSTEYTAYQFDVFMPPILWNFEHLGLLK